jgi:kynurenine aminotransferase
MLSRNPDNPVGKVYSREELQKIADICLKNQIIILSDEVYDRLYYVPFTRLATLSPEVEKITITVGSAGKNFYATGWRVGKHIDILLLVVFADIDSGSEQVGSWDLLS